MFKILISTPGAGHPLYIQPVPFILPVPSASYGIHVSQYIIRFIAKCRHRMHKANKIALCLAVMVHSGTM